MAGIKGDYTGFTYNGVHSSELGITRVSDGSRYNENLLPTMQDKTVQVPGADGTYYFGSFYTQRQFNVSFAFDDLTEAQVARLKSHFGDKGVHDLIFDETPYKIWSAKVTGTATIKYLPFAEGETNRLYKGEGSIQFTCYKPYARCEKKSLADFAKWENIDEWAEASGLPRNLNHEESEEILFEENFDGFTPYTITNKANWIKFSNGTGYYKIEDGKMLLNNNSDKEYLYLILDKEGSENWNNYVIEYDISYFNGTGKAYAGLMFNIGDINKYLNHLKVGIYSTNSFFINGESDNTFCKDGVKALSGKYWIDNTQLPNQGITEVYKDWGKNTWRIKLETFGNNGKRDGVGNLYIAQVDDKGQVGEYKLITKNASLHYHMWKGTIGLMADPTTQAYIDNIRIYKPSKNGELLSMLENGRFLLANPGDIDSHFSLILQAKEGKIPAGDISIEGTSLYLSWKDFSLKEGDEYIKINTSLNLIEGYDTNDKKTGKVYNEHIIAGNFFKIPHSKDKIYDLIIMGEIIGTPTIEYNYYYF